MDRLAFAAVFAVVLAQTVAAQSPEFQMPGGFGCAGEIARYRAVQQNDLSAGNVAKSVYAQIEREIAAAEKVCAAGEEAKASAMVRASQAKHGYPTHI